MFVLKVYNIEGGIKVERNLYKRIKKLLFWDKILRNEEFLNFIYRYDIGYRIYRIVFDFKCVKYFDVNIDRLMVFCCVVCDVKFDKCNYFKRYFEIKKYKINDIF